MGKIGFSKLILFLVALVVLFVFFGCDQPEKQVNLADLTSTPAGVIGLESAPVTIIEYSDYQCPFCRKWVDESKKQLFDDYVSTGKVKFIFKDFPLNGHPLAKPYAISVRCAGEQGKYFEMHDKMYLEQGKLAGGGYTMISVTSDEVIKWAGELGLDTNAYFNCLVSNKFDSQIGENAEEAANIGITGTPSFVIGKTNGKGVLVVGAVPYSTLKSKIEEMLK